MILIALGLVGLTMLGLILYSLFSGPDYQNEDYVPPPPGELKPLPDFTVNEVEDIRERSVLYAQTVPRPVRCELSNPGIDTETATDAELKDYMDELMACNMRVWDQPFVATQRFELVRPKVNIYGESISTPCGDFKPNGAYCGANQEVYWSRLVPQYLPAFNERLTVDVVMTHEFAHAVQMRIGILLSTGYTQQQVDKKTLFELNRRKETQADCFAGMVINSIAQSMDYDDAEVARMIAAIRSLAVDEPEEDDTHGSGPTREYWFRVGLSGSDIGRCNTYTVPRELVR